jgi:predicted nucleotidyltransferase
MTTLVDLLIEQKKQNEKYFLEYRDYSLKVKEITKKWLNDETKVLVFGSVVRGEWIPNRSDIDVLIISENVSKSAIWQGDLKIKILSEIGDLTAPFEFHFATPEQYKNWYQKFIRNDYVEV